MGEAAEGLCLFKIESLYRTIPLSPLVVRVANILQFEVVKTGFYQIFSKLGVCINVNVFLFVNLIYYVILGNI